VSGFFPRSSLVMAESQDFIPQERGEYSKEEINALHGIFTLFDADNSGYIQVGELENILAKIGKNPEEAESILIAADKVSGEQDGQISFNEFLDLLELKEEAKGGTSEGPDPKVLEFLRILEEYRMKCEEEGDYLEAGRANRQLSVLKAQEEKRQQKQIRARQIAERQDVQIAHNMQYNDFNAAWDKYMEEYDSMAQMYIQQMTERHAVNLLEFQKNLQREMQERPPKWSRELLEWRRRQHMLARQKNYAEAQKIKKIADQMEEREKQNMQQTNAAVFARKEAKFRQQQQAELQALLKRIDARRKEHLKQRSVDSKRLLQRNRNVQTVLESKQNVECNRLYAEVKKTIHRSTLPQKLSGTASFNSVSKSSVRRKKRQDEEAMPEYSDAADDVPSFLQDSGPSLNQVS